MEACYDTPWDRQCVNTQLLLNGFVTDKNNTKQAYPPRSSLSKSQTPPCGVQAQKMLKSKQINKVQADARPDSEYDVPWDRGRVERRIKGELTNSILRKNRPTSQTADKSKSVGRSLKASSACFTGDATVPQLRLPPHDNFTAGQFDSSIDDDRLVVCCAPSVVSSSSTSPASCNSAMSKTSSSSISLSKLSKCIRNAECNNEATDHVVPEYDNVKPKISSSSQRTPLLETVFCGVSPSQPSAQELLASIKMIEKDKLMQKLSQCAQLSPVKKPKPAVRKSKQNNTKKNDASIPSSSKVEVNKPKISEVHNAVDTKKEELNEVEYDVPWESDNQLKIIHRLKEKDTKDDLSRNQLSLNFACARSNQTSVQFDSSLPLQEQLWYHASISRQEAEGRLKNALEGSYLVRICESNRSEYALSLKSAKGYMHMKIQSNASGEWILGYFSQPFNCIPLMIKYYSINKLPIKGAEHTCLIHPLTDNLL